MAEIVVAKNRGKEAFHGKYNSREFVIPAGGEAIIDREAAVIWFGDWETRNIGRQESTQFRSQELERLKGIYGSSYDDRVGDPRTPKPLTAVEKWERNRPHIELFETDGTRIVGVLDDPQGMSLPLADAPPDAMARAIEEMQQQLKDMESRLLAAQESQATAAIPTDGPETSPQRRRGGVKVDPVLDETG